MPTAHAPVATEIRVLVRQEVGRYTAQCLEYDIAAQGATMKELEDAIIYAILAHVTLAHDHGDEPFEKLGRAPERFFEEWESLRDLGTLEIPAADFDQCMSKPPTLKLKAA